MSNYPYEIDTDVELPPVNDNVTEVGGDAINALRDAVFNIEQALGLNPAGSTSSLSQRINVSIDPDGYINPIALSTLGLVTLPITGDQISNTAGIPESKLDLSYSTIDLYNYILELSKNVSSTSGWVSVTGTKLDPHLNGVIYRHALADIDVADTTSQFLNNKFRQLRDNDSAYSLINDMNAELLNHQWADGSTFGTIENIITNNGSIYPSNYGHTGSGIYLQSNSFASIPQTVQDVQKLAEYIDSSGIFLYGSRIQNLYANGISRKSTSSSLTSDGYGQPIIPETPAIAFLRSNGAQSYSVDSIFTGTGGGDDIVQFAPSAGDISSNKFDEQFALVKVGDVLRINYGTVETQFLIKEKLYIESGPTKQYVVRIAGKNLAYTANATARIDRPLFNTDKYGVLAVASANYPVRSVPNNTSAPVSSLIVGSPRGAQALGVGFNPDQFDSTHYALYLALYPNGNPDDGYVILPSIDVTGNQGSTPGAYTLDSVVAASNNTFRKAGYNYRFIAYSYQGEFGIMLADSINNASFSILSGVVKPDGTYDAAATAVSFTNNAVGIISQNNLTASDPLGFGPLNGNIASPPYMPSYGSAAAALIPTKLFVPLKRNNYYVEGAEKEKLNFDIGQVIDGYGDGYWEATIEGYASIPGPSVGRVSMTYLIPLDLSISALKSGKTIVVQPLGEGGITDFGRFIIESVEFTSCSDTILAGTRITVYDAVHAAGVSPFAVAPVGTKVAIYFSQDSVSFNLESATDSSAFGPFKRHFEVFVDQSANTFTHERGRMFLGTNPGMVNGTVPLYTDSSLNQLNILKISPKLRGYQFGFTNKITLLFNSYDNTTGAYDGYLSYFNGTNYLNPGPLTHGQRGQVTRFYDETNVDYIDVVFDLDSNNNIHTISTPTPIDIQLFPTLSLDESVMMVATCQLNDSSNFSDHFIDQRQFGNISEEELSTSALNFISLPQRLLQGNGVIRGFDLDVTGATNPNNEQIYLTGGVCLVNGKIIQMNADTVTIPVVQELYGATLFNINWVLCVNDKSEYQPIPLLDFDPILNTPNNSNRLISLFNVNNSVSYLNSGSTFSDIINNRKDLTPIWIVSSSVTAPAGINPATSSLSLSDCRKYVNDGNTTTNLKITAGGAQGNFKSARSIFNWLEYNSSFNGIVSVKGANANNSTVDGYVYLTSATIDGENNATLIMNGAVSLGSNVTLKNMNITFNGGLNFVVGANNINLINCNVIINNPSSGTFNTNNVTMSLQNCSNVTIDGCTFTVNYNNVAGIAHTGGAVFYMTNTSKFTYINCSNLTVNYVALQGTSVPGDIFVLRGSANCTIANSGFNGNFNEWVRLTDGSNTFTADSCIVTSTYTPYNGTGSPDNYTVSGVGMTDPLGALDGLSPVLYNQVLPSTTGGDIVNSGRGYFYAQVLISLTDIKINNVIFNCNQASASNGFHRFSFINFELASNSAILSNLTITGCQFKSTFNTTATVDDMRPAIAIINKAPTSASAYVQQPMLRSVIIANNKCNRSHSILVTSKTYSGVMTYPGLSTKNVQIKNNNCGTIGHWTSSGTKVTNITPNTYSDKASNLIISENDCHYIGSLDSTGTYFLPSRIVAHISTNLCQYPTGSVAIRNNTANWIHTGTTYEENSQLIIDSNHLAAYDISYLASFKDGGINTDGYPNAVYNPVNTPDGNPPDGKAISTNYAIFVGTNKTAFPDIFAPGEGNDGSITISNNTVNSGYWMLPTFSPVNYQYGLGYIFSQGSCNINDNNLRGVADTASKGSLILLSGLHNVVSRNKIYRKASTIYAYVTLANYDTIQIGVLLWDGSQFKGIVKDNFFDSPYCNNTAVNTDNNLAAEAVVKYNYINTSAYDWNVSANRNQTGYISVPLNESILDGYSNIVPNSDTNLHASFLYHPQGIFTGGIARSLITAYYNSFPVNLTQPINWVAQLDKLIPQGARLVLLSLGLKSGMAALPALTAGKIVISVYYYSNPTSYLNIDTINDITGSDSNILNYSFSSPGYIVPYNINYTTINGATASTAISTIDITNQSGVDKSKYFVSGSGSPMTAQIEMTYTKNDNPVNIIFAPLLVKYRW